ncbi:MAG: fasciclin domain-containing protein [Wenzhouxiangella sp.]
MKNLLASIVIAAFVIFAGASQAGARPAEVPAGPPSGVVPGDQTIAEIVTEAASNDPAEFSLLLAAIGYIAETNPDSALIAGLFDDEQYTVFAPNDQAFLALVGSVAGLLDPDVLNNEGPFAAIDDLLGAGTIEAVVSYHVTFGRRAANSVVPRRSERIVETLLEDATFSVDSSATITAIGSTAGIEQPDIAAANGIIHVIDTVLLPIDLGL